MKRTMAGWMLPVLLLAACGGSGSTGLILPESGAIEMVRREGGCVEVEGTAVCATTTGDPGVPDDVVARGGDLSGFDPGAPCHDAIEPRCVRLATFTLTGFPLGAACAVAAREGPEERWTVGALTTLSDPGRETTFPLAPGAPDGVGLEIALLCFETPPDSLPAEIDALLAVGPDYIFVPR